MAITAISGGPQTFSPASGGKVYGYNNINETTATVVAQANPSRQKIRFHNPGTHSLYIAQSFVQNVLGTAPTQPANVALTLTNAAIGGSWLLTAGSSLEIVGECQQAWQALAITGAGTGNPLTVTDSNIG